MKFSPLLVLFCLFSTSVQAQWRIGIESGLVFTQYNDVRVPNEEQQRGTLFSFADDFTPNQPAAFLRFELAYTIREKHTIELTAAPLQIEYEDAQLDVIDFAGSTFDGEKIDGRYEFNTYRISYRYRFIQKPKVSLDAGASILIRDARIALFQNGLQAEDVDLGFVPLVSFEFNYSPSESVAFLLKGDALVGPQGRAEDIFAGALFDLLDDQLQLKAGYRLIEGGADVGQVYNFAFIHFVDLGLVYHF